MPGGPEMMIILVIALLVLGPEQLPKAMRTFGNAQAQIKKVTGGIQAEVQKAMASVEAEVKATTEEKPPPAASAGPAASSSSAPARTTPDEVVPPPAPGPTATSAVESVQQPVAVGAAERAAG